MTMTASTGRHELAQQAWSALPHGGRNEVRLQVQCSRAHHMAKLYETGAGLVYVAPLRAHSHGSRDRFDRPHGEAKPGRFFDLLGDADEHTVDDALPAWCDCGPRTLSRAALHEWLAAAEHHVIVD
jgi:hypothetical protein